MKLWGKRPPHPADPPAETGIELSDNQPAEPAPTWDVEVDGNATVTEMRSNADDQVGHRSQGAGDLPAAVLGQDDAPQAPESVAVDAGDEMDMSHLFGEVPGVDDSPVETVGTTRILAEIADGAVPEDAEPAPGEHEAAEVHARSVEVAASVPADPQPARPSGPEKTVAAEEDPLYGSTDHDPYASTDDDDVFGQFLSGGTDEEPAEGIDEDAHAQDTSLEDEDTTISVVDDVPCEVEDTTISVVDDVPSEVEDAPVSVVDDVPLGDGGASFGIVDDLPLEVEDASFDVDDDSVPAAHDGAPDAALVESLFALQETIVKERAERRAEMERIPGIVADAVQQQFAQSAADRAALHAWAANSKVHVEQIAAAADMAREVPDVLTTAFAAVDTANDTHRATLEADLDETRTRFAALAEETDTWLHSTMDDIENRLAKADSQLAQAEAARLEHLARVERDFEAKVAHIETSIAQLRERVSAASAAAMSDAASLSADLETHRAHAEAKASEMNEIVACARRELDTFEQKATDTLNVASREVLRNAHLSDIPTDLAAPEQTDTETAEHNVPTDPSVEVDELNDAPSTAEVDAVELADRMKRVREKLMEALSNGTADNGEVMAALNRIFSAGDDASLATALAAAEAIVAH